MTEEEGKEESAKTALTEYQQRILGNLKNTELHLNIVVCEQKFSLGDLSRLSTGSILNFDVDSNEEAFLTVNGRKFAQGNIVKVNENYGMRIKEICNE